MIFEIRIPQYDDFNIKQFEEWCGNLNKDIVKFVDKSYARSIVFPNWWYIKFEVDNKNSFVGLMQVYFQDVEWYKLITIQEI